MLKLEIKEGINPKEFFPDAKHIIIYAFTIGERHYFRFDDPLNTPYKRGLDTLVYYKEYDMNCDRDFLKAHTQAIDNMLIKGKFTINDLLTVKTLNDQLKQRLELPKEPDLMYKLASVVFFDQKENPNIYEFKYGENKIRFWKKNISPEAFFLSQPLKVLIPYLASAEENLLQYSQLTEKVSQQQLESLLPLLSEEQRTVLLNKFRSFVPTLAPQ